MFDTLMDSLSGHIDRAVLRAQAVGVANDKGLAQLSYADRMARLGPLGELYGDPALLMEQGGFLQQPPTIDPVARSVGSGVVDLSWPSDYVPWNGEVAAPYLAHTRNRTVHARLFAVRPGPTVMLVHGYGAGHFGMETYAWPVSALRRRGWNVVMATLPFHARRAGPGRALTPPFPAADPRVTNEGFRQAIHDVRALHNWLRSSGQGPVGVWGISLGGYTAGLLATVDPTVAFAALVLPLGSPADYARHHGRLGQGAEADTLHAAIEAANRVISPYARPPLLPPQRVRVLAARGDRITGPVQAGRLARHFGVEPELCAGAHIVNAGLLGAYPTLVEWVGDGSRFA